MNLQTILRQQITNHLLENPIDRKQPNPYVETARYFNVHPEVIRSIWRKLRKKGLVENNESKSNYFYQTEEVLYDINQLQEYYNLSGIGSSELNIEQTVDTEIKSLEDLIIACDIDLDEWSISKWSCKKYNAWIKKDGEIFTEPKWSVSARLEKRIVDKDLPKQKDILLDEIKKYLDEEKPKSFIDTNYVTDGFLLELSAPDLHVGKLSWKDESGEDYDLKIACERYKNAIKDLLSKVPIQSVEKILLPIGNDMITIDSRKNQTTAGTPQDSDSRFRKMLLTVKNLLISIIDDLTFIAPVDVVVVSGNHDYDSMFTIGMVLEAFYHNNSNVSIDNRPTQRKYYEYGKVGIQFTHGNEEKHADLGLIFATEQPEMWGRTRFREVQLGHFHKNKKVNFVSVDEYQGFQVQILPSLSGTDAWHNTKGYNSLKQAKAFLYDREEGRIAEINHTIK